MTAPSRSPRTALAGVGISLVVVMASLLATLHAAGPRTLLTPPAGASASASASAPASAAQVGAGTLPPTGPIPSGSAAASASAPPTTPPPPIATGAPVASGTLPATPAPATQSPTSATPLDTATGKDIKPPVALPARVDLYAGAVSITAGQPLELHVSTAAAGYRLSIARSDATVSGGSQVVATVDGRPGHDYRALATYDSLTRTARANWPVTDRVVSSGWSPGVYIATATDTSGTLGRAIFVVRNQVLTPNQPVFVFSALTYQAYNLWGGGNLYGYAGPKATRVSFERPYDQAGGRGFWTKSDDRILAWLQRRQQLQYTTDYDLAVAPPAIVPRLVIFPRHTEYVPLALRDWLEHYVNDLGYMNVLSFGANGFYWQVRLAAARTAGAPLDIVCYKSAAADPEAAAHPGLATVRWQDEPVNRPEGAVIGSQYAEVVADGYARYNLSVTADAPAWLLQGTGWVTGTVARGLLQGEADAPYPGSGSVGVLAGVAPDPLGHRIYPASTIRVSPAGSRIFDAGSFGWADGLSPAVINMGTTQGSFDRLNENLLRWLGFPVNP